LEAWIKIIIGVVFLALSLGYLYRPGWVLKMNALGRAFLFNDTHILHYRRRWGLPLFAAAAVFLFVGLKNLAETRSAPSSADLWLAHRAFLAREYREAIVRCEGILAVDQTNFQAWSLLGSAWSALGDQEKAKKAWNRSLALVQTDPQGRPTPPQKR
jgi:hypothetical protein